MYRVLVEEPEGKNYFEDLSTGMRVTLKRILKKQDSSGLGKGKLTGSCECFKFHIMAGIPWQAEEITSFQEGLSSMEFLKSVVDFSNIRVQELD